MARALALAALCVALASAKAATHAPTPAVDFSGCTVDADCTKVELKIDGNCCWLGEYVAVNVSKVDAWNKAHQCTNNQTVCPLGRRRDLAIIFDPDVPLCISGQCEMVAPSNVSCNGFTPNPHHCPPEYTCVQSIPDVPGHCVQYQGTCGGKPNKKHHVKKCTNPAFPFCQNGICVAECFENQLCVKGSVWSPTACKCVGGSIHPTSSPVCVDNVLCKNGFVWSPAACKCVAGTYAPTFRPIRPICDPIICPTGQHWDLTLCKCVGTVG